MTPLYLALPLSVLMISAAIIDIKTRKIPNYIIIAGLAIGIAVNVIRAFVYCDFSIIISCLAGALAGGLPLIAVSLASHGGMGMGDVKFMAMIGSFLGPRCAIEALIVAILAGGVYGVILLILKKKNLKSAFAFGPFLAFGGFCVIFLDKYIHQFLAVVYHIPI